MESIDEIPRANLAHPNIFTFYMAIGVKCRLLFPLSLKCSSKENRRNGTIVYFQYFDEFSSTGFLAAVNGC